MSGRIDVHQHIIPARYQAYLDEVGVTAAGLAAPAWSEDLMLASMDKYEVETAILSLSMPGVHFGDDMKACAMAREVNEFAADLAARRPERFGLFATLTLPDVEGSLTELAYAFDELGADGVILLANVGGLYLGNPRFEAVLAELDRRRAIVFLHPSQMPGPPPRGYRPTSRTSSWTAPGPR